MSAGSRGKAEADGGAGRIAPGVRLRAELQRLGLDQVAVSKAAGVSRQSVNNIINGRQAISRAMAGKLGRLTGHSSDYWLSEWFSEKGTARIANPPARATGLLVDHQIVRAVKDGLIGIDPFTKKNVQPASVNLTLNNVLAAGGKRISLARGKAFVLRPGRAVIASTLESIEFPRDYLGRIGATPSLSGHGIILIYGLQVEPGFKGRLRFGLFNAGSESVRLVAREPVIGLEIVRLGAVPELPPA